MDNKPPQPISPSPRGRLQELLAIPERQRTEAEWDEINELEIMLAPGNRPGAPDHSHRGNDKMNHGHSHGQPRPGGQPHGKKPVKKFHKRPPKHNPR
jgi:hypothetical protein